MNIIVKEGRKSRSSFETQ